jgi:tetratricopeptide (TPR) repeat protein
MKTSASRPRVNGKRLVVLLLAAAATVAGVHFLHAFQARRSARELLDQAARAEDDGHLPQAIDSLKLYLSYVPEDFEARTRYGLLLARTAATPKDRARAYSTLEGILRRTSDGDDVRHRVVELAISIGRFGDARDHLKTLRQHAPDDVGLDQLGGECEEAAREYAPAASWYLRASLVRPNPSLTTWWMPRRVEGCVRLADVLHHRLGQSELAEKVLDRMVDANTKSFQAYLARAHYRQQLARAARKAPQAEAALKQAAADTAEALRLVPEEKEPEVLLSAADVARQRKDDAAARLHLSRLMMRRPKDVRPYLALARLDLELMDVPFYFWVADHLKQNAGDLLRHSLKLPAHPLQLWEAADLLITLGDPASERSARDTIGRLRKDSALQPLVRFLEARLLAREGKWLEASQRLEAAGPFLGQYRELADLARRADMLLGQSYQKRGNPDQALAAFRRAARVEPSWVPARLGVAGSLLSLGRLEEALEEYRRLAPVQPEFRLPLARLLILHNLKLPRDRRNWDEVRQVLDGAAQADQLKNDVVILRAELLAAQADREHLDSARKLLETERARQPRHAPFWVALAGIHRRQGDVEGARRLLEQAQREVGDVPELRLALARHWSRSRNGEGVKALLALEAGLDRFTRTEQTTLLGALAECHYRLRQPAEARRLLSRLAALEPADLNTRLALFDLALHTNNTAGMREGVAAIRNIEGLDGALWRFGEAARLIARGRGGDRSGLAEARTRLVEAAAKRPGWSRVPLLQADLEELEGHEDAAIGSYLQAVEQGDRQPVVIRRLVGLLYERQRYGEASQVLRRLLEQEDGLSGELSRLGAEVSLRTRDYSRAAELAHEAVRSGPTDYRDQVWLGQILWAAGRKHDAETVLQKAVTDFSGEPDVWVAWIRFLHQSGQKEKAKEAIHQAEKKLSADKAALALAECQEAVGLSEDASQLYMEALKKGADSVLVLQRVADYLLRTGRPREAVPLLRRVLEHGLKAPAADLARTRRNLAFALATAGGPKEFAEALALADANLKASGSVEDQRVKAAVLATRSAHRREAIRLLEESFQRRQATPAESFLLARLYEAEGNWSQAHDRFVALVVPQRARPEFLAHYADSLLRRKEASEAQMWLVRLEKLEPDALRTLDLKARVLAARGKTEEAVRLLVEHAAKEKKSERLLGLAESLGALQKVGTALDLCERAAPAGLAGAAATAASVVRASGGAEGDCRRAERLLEQALAKGGRHPGLLRAQAELRDFQGRYEEARALYTEALKQGSADPVLLNNLAWLLVLDSGRSKEALELINRALEAAGPVGGLLDTRAVIYLALGRTEDARRDLEKAVKDAPTPARYFHLALAHHAGKNPAAAAQALQKARALGLTLSHLHPLERNSYERLTADLARR